MSLNVFSNNEETAEQWAIDDPTPHKKKGSIRGLNYYLEEIIVYNLIYYIEYKI